MDVEKLKQCQEKIKSILHKPNKSFKKNEMNL